MSGYATTRKDGRCVDKHVLVAEAVLGRRLRLGEQVHHVNENKKNNSNANLVICTEQYHRLLHVRMRAFAASGHWDWRKCPYCKQYDAVDAMYNRAPNNPLGSFNHRACQTAYKLAKRLTHPRKSRAIHH